MNEETRPSSPEPQNSLQTAASTAATSTETASIETVCPTCKRKLLTQTSPLCNWCGAQINNPEYQARAAQSRLERDQQERAGLEAVIQEEARHGILGRLKRLGKQNKVAPPKSPLV